jgi:hypothetical protein
LAISPPRICHPKSGDDTRAMRMGRRAKGTTFILGIILALIVGASTLALIVSAVHDGQEKSATLTTESTAKTIEGPTQETQAALPVTASAGPDQTVPGPSPVAVQFDGSRSIGGKETPPKGDPITGSTFTGTYYYSDDAQQTLVAGFLTDKSQWYVRITELDQSTAEVECHFGEHWQNDNLEGSYPVYNQGCVGDLEVTSSDPSISGVMEPTPIYEEELITGWAVGLDYSGVASITFGEGQVYKFAGSSDVLNQKW